MPAQGTIIACPNCGKKNRVRPSPSGVPRCSVCHTVLPWIVEAGRDSFEAELDASVPVLVDFWAPGAGRGRTRLGRDLDTTADLAFLTTAALRARATGRISPVGFRLLAARQATGAAVSLLAVFARARRARNPRPAMGSTPARQRTRDVNRRPGTHGHRHDRRRLRDPSTLYSPTSLTRLNAGYLSLT